jgi:phosphoribosylamine--glycine ligase
LAQFSALTWRSGYSVTVVVAAAGYPASPVTGDSIVGIDQAESLGNVTVYHAGTKEGEGSLVTSGGRVLSVTAHAGTLAAARELATEAAALINIAGSHFRGDIAQQAAAGHISIP